MIDTPNIAEPTREVKSCSHDKCSGQALYRPMLSMRRSVKSPPVVARFSQLALCELHKDEACLKDFISDESWGKIIKFMREAGKPPPAKNLTTLYFERLNGPETDDEALPF